MKNSSSIIRILSFIIFLYIAVLFQTAAATVPGVPNLEISFDSISLEQGLSQVSVITISQDKKGFMWFGTEDGLNKYDGYEFSVFRNDPTKSTTLSDSSIRYIYTDKNGDLWACTFNRGLNKYDRETGTFIRYLHKPDDPGSIGHDEVSVAYEDGEKNFWVGTLGGGLDKFDRATGHFLHYRYMPNTPNNPGSLNCNFIKTIFEDSKSRLWIGTYGGGLNILDRSSQDKVVFRNYSHDPRNPASLNNNFITCMIETAKGVLWVGTEGGGISRFDPDKGTFKPYIYKPGNPVGLSHNNVTCILEAKDGKLWIGTYGGGLNILDPLKETFAHYRHKDGVHDSLNHDYILSIYKDNTDVLWIGTLKGINKFDLERLQFFRLGRDAGYPNSLNDNDIRAIYEDSGGILWIGAYNGGITKFDRRSGRFTHYTHNPRVPGSISDNRIFAILRDSSGVLWAGSFGGGLMSLDEKTGKVTHYRNIPADPASLICDNVRTIYEDSKHRLWIATIGGGLDRFNPEKKNFSHYQHNPDNPLSISSDKVFTLQEDRDGMLWIGTFGGGLDKFDPGKEVFTHYPYNPNNENSLSCDRIFSIHIQEKMNEGDEGIILWISTDGGGLNRFDTRSGQWKRIYQGDVLPSNVIYGILEDGKGNLWLSTTKGLSVYNLLAPSYRNYTAKDGMQNTEYNSGAYYRNPVSGEMFFGGLNGLNSFFPDTLTIDPRINPVVIKSFRKFNRPLKPNQFNEEMKEIKVSYRDNFFSFDFVAPEYRNPDRNQYIYILEGHDNKWTQSGVKRHADYTNIPGGRYVFKVKSINPTGAISEASIKIKIIPPFWLTWWFRITAFILVSLIAFAGIQLRTRVIRKKNRWLEDFNRQLQQEIVDRQQAELLQATLYQIAEITHSDMEFDEIYRSIHQAIAQLIDAENFYIALYNAVEDSISLPYFVDKFDDYMGRTFKSFKGLTEYIIRNNMTLLATTPVLRDLIEKGEISLFGTMPKIWLGVPLRFKDEIFGAVVVQHYSNPNAYTEKDKRVLEFASDQIAGVISRKREAEEKKDLKEKLVLSEKMEAIGRLAGGVAHDLNNVLSAIVSYPELLLMKLPLDSPLRKPLLTVKQSGQRAAAIVQDLLTLARRGVEVNEVINWNDILQDYLKSPVFEKLKASHPNIEINVNLDKHLLNIEGSPVHLTKTLMNLCSNAAEAMPQGGTITLATCNLYQDKELADIGISNYVVVSISDTGVGIAKKDLKRIFEPFYTTKSMGISGTGLGMAIVWNTVHDHNGYINVSSEEGNGTIFELYFPVTYAAVSKKEKAVGIEEFKGHGERILVIDDMLEQREILSVLLAELGYSVVCVSRGEEAVNYMKEQGSGVQLLILDMIMEGGMDGLDTYKEILKIKPGIRAVIASGFSETARVKEAVQLGAGAYIKKPYTLEKIGLALKMELEK
ncbi:MAG: hypothetical protein QG657_3991 [Acidobacteriota bacterium]|nr:hypothetical protein [Acidobacteriota bacterium]